MIRKNSRFMTLYAHFLRTENLNDYFNINESDVEKFLLFMLKHDFNFDLIFYLKVNDLMKDRMLNTNIENSETSKIKSLCKEIFQMYKDQ